MNFKNPYSLHSVLLAFWYQWWLGVFVLAKNHCQSVRYFLFAFVLRKVNTTLWFSRKKIYQLQIIFIETNITVTARDCYTYMAENGLVKKIFKTPFLTGSNSFFLLILVSVDSYQLFNNLTQKACKSIILFKAINSFLFFINSIKKSGLIH